MEAQIAYDSAGDSAYNAAAAKGFPSSFLATIPVGTNGGFGWGGGWEGPDFPPPIYQYGLIVFPSDAIAVNSPPIPGGRAFCVTGTLHDGPPQINNVVRRFNGDLETGQTFSVDFELSKFAFNSHLIMLLNPEMQTIYSISPSLYLEDTYLIRAGSGVPIDTGLAVTPAGAHLDVTVLDPADVRVTLTSLDGSGASVSYVLPYTAADRFDAQNGVGNSGLLLTFNNLAITPEPASSLVLPLGAALLLHARRRT